MTDHEKDLKMPKILYVDDLKENQLVIKSLLKNEGYKVHTALNGQEALRMVLKKRYDLFILDVQMPEMDGFELAEHLKGINRTRDIPIIFLTSVNTEMNFVKKGLELGAVDYLNKPVDDELLKLKVKTFLQLYLQHVELLKTKRQLNRANKSLEETIEELKTTLENLEDALSELKETKSTADTLNKTLKSFKQLADESGQGIGMANLDESVMYGNPKLLSIIEESDLSSVEGTKISKYYRGWALMRLEGEAIPTLMTTGEWTGELEITGINGKSTATLENYFLVKDHDGKPSFIAVIITDISEQKMLERELKGAKNEAEDGLQKLKITQSQLVQSEKMASLGQLTAGIAHEINNPVGFIRTSSFALDRDLNDILELLEKYREYIRNGQQDLSEIADFEKEINVKFLQKALVREIEDIKEGTKRTSEIVQGLRAFSREDSIEMQPANIHAGVDNTLKILNSRLNKNLKIIKKYDKSTGQINCHIGQLNQVFMNILTNSLDAIGDKGQIVITTQNQKESVIISIKDNGPGIPEEIRDKIFDPFFTTKEVGKGTGLGLSISHGIIGKHGGKIEVKSEVGKGSEFVIILPIA